MSTIRLLAFVLLALSITAPASASLGVCAADIDGDGIAGSSDLNAILGAWGTADPRVDLNGNGYVGDADLNTLFDQWGACNTCPDLDGDGTVGPNDRKRLAQAYGRITTWAGVWTTVETECLSVLKRVICTKMAKLKYFLKK